MGIAAREVDGQKVVTMLVLSCQLRTLRSQLTCGAIVNLWRHWQLEVLMYLILWQLHAKVVLALFLTEDYGPFQKRRLFWTRLTVSPHAVQMWSRYPSKTGPNETCVDR